MSAFCVSANDGLTMSLPSTRHDAHAGDGLRDGRVGDVQRRGGPAQREHVGLGVLVVRHDGRDDLELAAEVLGEQRADGAVDEAAR
jgi:hypothetical protein